MTIVCFLLKLTLKTTLDTHLAFEDKQLATDDGHRVVGSVTRVRLAAGDLRRGVVVMVVMAVVRPVSGSGCGGSSGGGATSGCGRPVVRAVRRSPRRSPVRWLEDRYLCPPVFGSCERKILFRQISSRIYF